MKQYIQNIRKSAKGMLLLTTLLAAAMASCDSVLDHELGDCTIQYQVKFKYDYNMKKVDAFAQDVKSVTLYAFDENGKLAYQKTEQGEKLATGEYAMDVEMTPGEYELITWAGLDDQSFAVPVLQPGVSTREDLNVLTRRNIEATRGDETEEGKYVVSHDLPSLFWARSTKVTFTDKINPTTRARNQVVDVMDLHKNTNTVRVVVAQVADANKPVTRAINKDRFSYALYDDNGKMNYDNSLMEDNLLTYMPYVVEDNTIKTRAYSSDGSVAEYPAAVAEISTVRLLDTKNPRLEIKDVESGKDLLPSDKLIGYLSLLKQQNLIDMPLQEYLDREDHFGMIFFVDENLTLLRGVIQINDWVINVNEFDL